MGAGGDANGSELELVEKPSIRVRMIGELPIDGRCGACGYPDFWQRSDGGWCCAVCHPQSPQVSVID